jgi:hypothetical protein
MESVLNLPKLLKKTLQSQFWEVNFYKSLTKFQQAEFLSAKFSLSLLTSIIYGCTLTISENTVNL